MSDLVELVGNMHMHTPYSDGEMWHAEIAEEAIAAGLDFIIVTDHNVWVDGVEGYYENKSGRVLLLTGEEIHNTRRKPQASHLLVYGTERELSPCAADPQQLINAVREAGGYCFLAHPHEKDCRLFPHPNLGWHDWEIEGYTGLEIWNYMSSFVCRLADALEKLPLEIGVLDKLTAVRVALNPEKHITFPEPDTLALWDELLAQGKQISAIGNSDAHGTPMSLGPIRRIIYPYETLFRAINTHILLPALLTGDVARDKQQILQAIGRGHSWVAYDLPHSTKGFCFSGHGLNKGTMGNRVQMNGSATLQIVTPTRANIKLIRHGEVVAAIENEVNLTHTPTEPGAYRVECTVPYLGQERGWIYSNPIYLF
ncbi:MAG: CehA/McbA family metallohydrolase [Chloroflexi bacterium]|nr:CehA/McbA family metallohydrolase [Chloroflexota bacterium]